MTYRFRIRAKTFTYGPEIEAKRRTGPGGSREPRWVWGPPSDVGWACEGRIGEGEEGHLKGDIPDGPLATPRSQRRRFHP